ncbi:LEAF RUST 10 DISEASE-RESISTANCEUS RECEPTOR-LIKE PROTEIN KINASE-like 2.2 isoform X2 [Cicer arietinum]|uniref:Rust resistance kinase Lr10-like isoform X2 n=1 Tax=Cicer arietinum TaxID=3827 RepID=A0A1S2Y484_CICAR|nr:rust resistance kinase Lr10-like isoform X2 [Cicer arietinum]
MSSLTLVVVVVVLVIFSYNSVDADEQQTCSQRCGVHNITHPFRLKDSPIKCGDQRYNLSCENNNQLILYNESFGKYYVQSINYNNFTIRLLDFNLLSSNSNSNSLLPYSLGLYNFSFYTSPYVPYHEYFSNVSQTSMLFVSCPNRTVDDGGNCMNSTLYGNSFYVSSYDKSLLQLGMEDTCRIEFMYLTSWPIVDYGSNISCMDIRRMMFYGFELSWFNSLCQDGWYVYFDHNNNPRCKRSEYGNLVALFVGSIIIFICELGFLLSVVKFVLGAPFIIVLLIYKWRRRHLSMYDGIEDFLRGDNNIMPIRYSYKDIKRMTQKFKTKLGNGGYGSVFKGQLRSGRFVAVKLLDKAKSNGQDFINEVSTIGRIHHVNVVHLIGFCVEGSKRALIYEFMSNGSLEKYIFSPIEESYSLSCEKLYDISLGVARGIEYLHNGCNIKILHFDIKPHNILLDENFNPKVSDFGLARLCPTNNSIVSLTAARGTIGYMAPELFYRNVGTISYKADVYSFGMLLMEMASRRRNLNALDEQESQIYFPFWVYDRLHDGREVTFENDTNHEMKLAKKMMIVALWCIQTKPSDRPSMDKVLEMLEEDGDLSMPNKPYLYPQDLPVEGRNDSISNSSTSYGTSISDPNEPTKSVFGY